MLINRYNYEELFLLYADGELPPLDMEIVDQFVQVHPDLKEELDMLMDCKLVADIPVFFPKEKLYKQTVWDEENITQLQSQLLLLLDNELPITDKKNLEKNIAENPVLEQEWNTLQQAKLFAETVAHPYKKPLYKQKRLPATMWRWAAAAAVILGAGWFFVGKNPNVIKSGTTNVVAKINPLKSIQNTVAKTLPNEQDDDAANEPDISPEQSEAVENNETDKNEENNTATSNENNLSVKKAIAQNTASKENAAKEEEQDDTDDELAQNDNSTDNNDERKILINHRNSAPIDDASNLKPQKAPAKFIGSTKNNLVIQNKNSQTESLGKLQADAEDNEYVHIAGAKVKKQKLRGMFRNITRGIGRTFSNSKVESASPVAVSN